MFLQSFTHANTIPSAVKNVQYLYLEGIFVTSDALWEREWQLIGTESCFNNAVDVDFVRRNRRVAERPRLHPLNSYVLKVHRPKSQKHWHIAFRLYAVILHDTTWYDSLSKQNQLLLLLIVRLKQQNEQEDLISLWLRPPRFWRQWMQLIIWHLTACFQLLEGKTSSNIAFVFFLQ